MSKDKFFKRKPIPFGLIFTKIFIKKDIRKVGSGNIGATNVLRTGNKILAIATLLLDSLKGFIPEYSPDFDFTKSKIKKSSIVK